MGDRKRRRDRTQVAIHLTGAYRRLSLVQAVARHLPWLMSRVLRHPVWSARLARWCGRAAAAEVQRPARRHG